MCIMLVDIEDNEKDGDKLIRRLGEWIPTPRPTWAPTRMSAQS